MEEIYDPAAIILKMDKMHKNMVADGTWSNTNENDTKIVALTSALDNVCVCVCVCVLTWYPGGQGCLPLASHKDADTCPAPLYTCLLH